MEIRRGRVIMTRLKEAEQAELEPENREKYTKMEGHIRGHTHGGE